MLKLITNPQLSQWFTDITSQMTTNIAANLNNPTPLNPWQTKMQDTVYLHALHRLNGVSPKNTTINNKQIIDFLNAYYRQDCADDYHIYAITDAGFKYLRQFARALHQPVEKLFPQVLLNPGRPGQCTGMFIANHDLFALNGTVNQMRWLYDNLFDHISQNVNVIRILNMVINNPKLLDQLIDISTGVYEIVEQKIAINVLTMTKDVTYRASIDIQDKRQAVIDVAEYAFAHESYPYSPQDNIEHIRFKNRDLLEFYLREFHRQFERFPQWAKTQ